MSTYELLYFPMNLGRANITRIMLNSAGATLKSACPAWPAEKENMPYGRLPVLVETKADGSKFTLCESQAIERYIARKYGFLPADLEQSAIAESYVDNIVDSIDLFYKHHYVEKNDASKEAVQKAVKYLISRHEPILAANPSGHYIGNKLSYPDIYLYHLYFMLTETGLTDFINESTAPHITKLAKSLAALPAVQ
ncbi:putative glutathione S-transferase 6 [Zancudomyces culisetae]|uniref:Putative glutathione S-transferase 6 n=1 Tax=Zancudomyces culisetae TaxID=1213189 RepID=A0A1R1PSV8_ZANCU|nr:putative glutathione S-transferase 6 [Zancudomyces culisetae]|eukprot:OMH83983.1 putative glutathione S-transferase 6 [Zancudomyces culisetae]